MHLRTIIKCLKLFCLTVNPALIFAQAPQFGREIPVTINGYSLDAMEPALSPDGHGLFFNSLNDGLTTSLYYATHINDSTYDFVDLVPFVNQAGTPRLDGVASIDSLFNFYWVSTRQYPSNPYNLHRIRFPGTGYSNFGRVYGDFYHIGQGWIIMDASISYAGEELLYCNAFFNNCTMNIPCESTIGMATKINDSTFNKMSNSGQVLSAINDTSGYIVYAPHLSKNGLELYYSRLFKANPATEVLVATRASTASPFQPGILIDDDTLSEAPVLSTDGKKLYYHKKTGNKFHIVLRYRQLANDVPKHSKRTHFDLFPNPASELVHSTFSDTLILYNIFGVELARFSGGLLDLSRLCTGVYLVSDVDRRVFRRLVKE